MKLSKTEQRVLAGMRLNDYGIAQSITEDIARGMVTAEEVAHLDRGLQGFDSILRAARIETWGKRKPTEREAYWALQRLVGMGLVAKDTVVGMGGGFTLYLRTEESPSWHVGSAS